MPGKRSLAKPQRTRMLDTLIIIGDRVFHLPTPKDESPWENIKREAINCSLQVLSYQWQVRISFMHNRNARAFFCCDAFMQKKASVHIPTSLFLNC